MVFNPGYPSELPGHLKRICVQASPQTNETSVSGDDIQASGTFKAPGKPGWRTIENEICNSREIRETSKFIST